MKLVLPALSLVFLFFSCSKSDKADNQPEEKLYPVSFSTSGFSQEISGLQKGAASTLATDPTYLNDIAYGLFDESGKLLKNVDQDRTQDGFGNIKESLPAGNYRLIIGASPVANGMHLSNGGHYFYRAHNDFFFLEHNFTVNGPVQSSLLLERKVGKLTLDIKDVVPANIASISMTYYDSESYDLFTPPTGIFVQTANIPIEEKHREEPSLTYSTYILNNAPFKVILTYYDTDGIGYSKTIENVRILPNKETILSGKLFVHDGGFAVEVDSSWDPNPSTVEF